MQPSENRQTVKVARCVVHHGFRVTNLIENDIAILVLAEPFIVTDTFEPTKLDMMNSKPVDHEPCQFGTF